MMTFDISQNHENYTTVLVSFFTKFLGKVTNGILIFTLAINKRSFKFIRIFILNR